ncbi:MAG: hypothetical protein U0694_09650 [Anaerolineae bacterium]
MRKLALVVVLCLFLVPTLAFAQDSQLLWDLSQVVDVDALGLRLNVPADWTAGEISGATYIVENADDLDTISGGGSPTGYAIAVSAFPLEALGDVTDETPLEDILASLNSSGSMELSETGTAAVNLRPAIYGVGTTNGMGTIITLWMQDANLIILGLAVPADSVDADSAFSWGNILGLIRPIVSDEITPAEERYEVTDLGFSMIYPEGWATADASEIAGIPGAAFAENESDLTAETPQGNLIAILQLTATLEDFGLDEDYTTGDLVEIFGTTFGTEDAVSLGSFVVNGQPGVGYTGTSASNGTLTITIVTHNEEAGTFTIYALGAVDEDAFELYKPVFLAMLWSIAPLES